MIPASVDDWRTLARRRLSRFAFDYLDGGAEDGHAIERNRRAFDRVLFDPRVLRDVAAIDTTARVLGTVHAMPMVVGPTGLNGLYWPRAEEVLAIAARDAGVPFALSTASTSTIEDVRAASDGELWMQLYVQEDRRIAEDLMRRAREARFTTLMLTVDTPVHGKRDHDMRNAFRLPLRPTPRLLVDLATHPRWCLRMLRQGGSPQLVNLARSAGIAPDLAVQAAALSRRMDMRLGWSSVAWMRDHWPGKVVVKGILCAADAVLARDHGVDAIVLSNHGGRQLESVSSPLDALPGVIDAVGDAIEVFVDGGVRRGDDIAKARALGARAVLLGRAPLYGLAGAGPAGVAAVLALLRAEYEIVLRLTGACSTAALDRSTLAAPEPR